MPARDPALSGAPRPFCFMVMPFGKRPSGSKDPRAPAEIDFDALWDRALRPALDELGYVAVRGDDEKLTENILRDILENLALCELVMADITAINANVFYEVGVRHAIPSPNACVLLAAEWAQPPFDVQGIRQLRYPLPASAPTEAEYARIRETLVNGIPTMRAFGTPMSLVKDYPNAKRTDARAFERRMHEIEAFQNAIREVRLAPRAERSAAATALLERYAAGLDETSAMMPSVVAELVGVARDSLGWRETLAFLAKLPEEVRDVPQILEQEQLALAKTGEVRASIARLEQLVRKYGSSPEREGLLGGRWKEVYESATNEAERREALDASIEHYERGMELDLNQYYCASNLPRLLRERGAPGDDVEARDVIGLVERAASVAHRARPEDRWPLFTLLGADFDTGDVVEAREHLEALRKLKPVEWELRMVAKDLEVSLSQQPPASAAELAPTLEALKALLPNGS